MCSPLEEIVEIVQSLTQLPNGDANAQLLSQLDAFIDRIKRRIKHNVATRFGSRELTSLDLISKRNR